MLVVGDRPVDGSRFRLPAVRRYLSQLKVPLQVWRVREGPADVYKPRRVAPDAGDPPPTLEDAELGPVFEVASIKQLRAALLALRHELDAQRIVWVEGHHLPQQVELGSRAAGARWAGSP